MAHKSILVIEDDQAVRQTIKDLLEIQGYQVYAASNGEEGASLLGTLAEVPCVILLDLMMPKMNGWQFLDLQRNHPIFKNVPVVICSAYEESAKAIRPTAFISKPIQLDALLSTVQKFCA